MNRRERNGAEEAMDRGDNVREEGFVRRVAVCVVCDDL